MRTPLAFRPFALVGALFVFILGAHWAVIGHFGSDLPFWDQWDAEGTRLLSPWLQHRFTLAMLVDHHNEHRVVLSRLLALGLTLANGQWDQRLECVVNALLPALVAAGFLVLALQHLPNQWRWGFTLLLMVIFGLPIAWENILRGFDSQQYFLISLSFGAIVWLPTAEPGTRRFWLGSACAVAALGSMATGFFASVVVGGMLLLRWAKKETSGSRIWPALAICAVTAAVGALTRVTVPYHAVYLARSFEDFSLAFRHSLQWPGYGQMWGGMAFLMWLPWAWLTAKLLLARPSQSEPLGPVLMGLGGWVILQLLATAYARGAHGPAPASRYEDTLAFGAAVNALALAWLWEFGSLRHITRLGLAAVGVLWAITFGLTTYQNCVPIFHDDLPNERYNNFYCEQNTRNYLATGDEAYLRHDEIPYPGTAAYLDHLLAPGLISLLPASVRHPLTVIPTQGGTAFRPDNLLATEGHRALTDQGQPTIPRGFSPATPLLTNRLTWGSFRGASTAETRDWVSQPLQAHRGWLKIEMAGQPEGPAIGLELRDAVTGRTLAQVRPDRTPGNTWRAAYVRAPTRPFVLVARDRDPTRWFAFSAPVEMGLLSHAAWRLTRRGLFLAEVAGLGALLLGLAESRRPRRT